MDDPAPLRITLSRGTADAVNRTFIGWFFAFAILFAGAAFYRPAIQAFAVGFPLYLVLWKLRLRRARSGWTLVVTQEHLVLEAPDGRRSVLRNQTAKIRIDPKGAAEGRAAFEVIDLSGGSALRQELARSELDRLIAALRDKEWTLEERASG
ncbi:MAG TPA: hypothetical protein VHI31_07605 [Actinomycetota bacterium]|nr:hypothetical protein [Actinomycetota bacterium]